MKLRIANYELRTSAPQATSLSSNSSFVIRHSKFSRAFTLIELILILSLLVVITSLVTPAMSGFIRGRALPAEARRLFALINAGQSRAVSEGMPMVLWINEKENSYGLEAETPPKDGDPKEERLGVDDVLQISVVSGGANQLTTIRNLPAIRFTPDGRGKDNATLTISSSDCDRGDQTVRLLGKGIRKGHGKK